jgi:hypothetical protein
MPHLGFEEGSEELVTGSARVVLTFENPLCFLKPCFYAFFGLQFSIESKGVIDRYPEVFVLLNNLKPVEICVTELGSTPVLLQHHNRRLLEIHLHVTLSAPV